MPKLLALILVTLMLSFSVCAENATNEYISTVEKMRSDGYILSEPLSVEYLEKESLEELKKHPSIPQVPFGGNNERWNKLKSVLRPGDVIVRFNSEEKYWKALAGRRGLCVLRGEKVIDGFVEALN